MGIHTLAETLDTLGIGIHTLGIGIHTLAETLDRCVELGLPLGELDLPFEEGDEESLELWVHGGILCRRRSLSKLGSPPNRAPKITPRDAQAAC